MAITKQEAISTVSKVVEAANIAESISSLCKRVDSDNIIFYSSPGKYEVAFKITDLLRDAITTLGIVFDESKTHIHVRDTNLVDMMAILYDNDKCGDNAYTRILNCTNNNQYKSPIVKMVKVHPDAVIPSKAHGSDVGYDLTVIDIAKVIKKDKIIMFDSGIQARIPWGTYLEIVPRSSLSKTGWMMANSIGIIDPSYRGNLMVACIKVDPDAAPLQLPFRGFQLIVRKQEHMTVVECENTDDSSTKTTRGAGGFGSTN